MHKSRLNSTFYFISIHDIIYIGENMKNIIEKIYDYSLEDMMGRSFGRYAKYIIQDRAIPDVRDGLKPVQRRILYSMYKDKYTYDKPYRKSARAVGDIMGKYHPHGDSSIYDAMVRLSQDWKINTPFIDMQGNNGSIDGDSPAAMRYTEARLSKISGELLKDIEKNTVIMSLNYDDSLEEPTVLPARFPNLLVNGSTGISAGYATNIPPHNLGEVIDAVIYRINQPNSRLDTIMNIVKGPDFPTGGIVEGKSGLEEAYKTGRGRVILKGKTSFEKVKGRETLVITEIPYDVNKSVLVKQIDEIRVNKKIDGILEVRDESDREGLRIAIDLKKGSNNELILNYLLKNTQLQTSYNFNMVAIVNRRPKQLGILDMLDAYIEHQKEIVTKRTEFDLEHAKGRYHIVEGFLKAMSILDEVIKVIRQSKNKSDAELNLIKEFNFTSLQAEAIVMLQLYRLTNTDVLALEEELKNLNIIISGLVAILSDELKLKEVIKGELKRIKREYAILRKTEIVHEITEIKIDSTMMIPKEDVIVVITSEGYVKRVSNRSYAQSKDEEQTLKEGDYVIGLYELNTLDTILLFTSLGNYLFLPVHEIFISGWKEMGKHISNIIPLKENEVIVGSIPVTDFDKEIYVTTFTSLGMVKRTLLKEYYAQRYSKPMSNMKIKKGDKVINVTSRDASEMIVVTNSGYALKFDTSEVSITGIRTSGVKTINLKDDKVVGALIPSSEYLTIVMNKGNLKRIKLSDIEKLTRSRRGSLIVKRVKSKPQDIVSVIEVNSKDLIGLKTKDDINIIKVSEVPIMDLDSIGSSVLKKELEYGFKVCELEQKEQEIVEKEVNLDEIDSKILTIDTFLKELE